MKKEVLGIHLSDVKTPYLSDAARKTIVLDGILIVALGVA